MKTPIEKAEKLSEENIKSIIEAYKVYSNFVENATYRMDYIVRYCVQACGGKVDWWDWPNENHDAGDFMNGYDPDSNSLTIHGKWSNNHKMVFIDKEGAEWELTRGEFPLRWLYEDFEEEYEKGLVLYQEKTQNRREKAKADKLRKAEERKILKMTALAKLTPEERKAIGLK